MNFHIHILELVYKKNEEKCIPILFFISQKSLSFIDKKFLLSHKNQVFGRIKKYKFLNLSKGEKDSLRKLDSLVKKIINFESNTRNYTVLPIKQESNLTEINQPFTSLKQFSEYINYEFGDCEKDNIFTSIDEFLKQNNTNLQELKEKVLLNDKLFIEKTVVPLYEKYHNKIVMSEFFPKEYFLCEFIDLKLSPKNEIVNENRGKDDDDNEMEAIGEYIKRKIGFKKIDERQFLIKKAKRIKTPKRIAFEKYLSISGIITQKEDYLLSEYYKMTKVPSDFIYNLKYLRKAFSFIYELDQNEKKLHRFQRIFEMKFHNNVLLREALTHSSFSCEFPELSNNERFEFLGDSILGVCVGHFLFENFPCSNKKSMQVLHKKVVCNEFLSEVGRGVQLLDYMLIPESQKEKLVLESKKTYADTIEAVIAASFLDQKNFRGVIEFCAKYLLNENIFPKIQKNILPLSFEIPLFNNLQLPEEIAKTLKFFEEKISTEFNNKFILLEALRHKSFLKFPINYEDNKYTCFFSRLSFLGEKVMDFIVSYYLFYNYPTHSQKEYTKARINFLKTKKYFPKMIEELELEKFVFHELDDDSFKVKKEEILKEVCFSIVAAIYLDQGGLFPIDKRQAKSKFDLKNEFVQKFFLKFVPINIDDICMDYKERLYQKTSKTDEILKFSTIDDVLEKKKLKKTTICLGDEIICFGFGENEKEAEQDASKRALSLYFEKKKLRKGCSTNQDLEKVKKIEIKSEKIQIESEDLVTKIEQDVVNRNKKNMECEICNIILEGESKYKEHENTKQHKTNKKLLELRMKNEEMRRKVEEIKKQLEENAEKEKELKKENI